MLPKLLTEQLETFSESQMSNDLGFTNKSQVAAFAIRQFLKNYSSFMSYLDFLDVSKEAISLRDHKLGKTIKIKIDSKTEELFCEIDKSQFCEHIRFVEELPRFKEALKKYFKHEALKPAYFTDDEMLKDIKRQVDRFSKYQKTPTNKKLLKIIKELSE